MSHPDQEPKTIKFTDLFTSFIQTATEPLVLQQAALERQRATSKPADHKIGATGLLPIVQQIAALQKALDEIPQISELLPPIIADVQLTHKQAEGLVSQALHAAFGITPDIPILTKKRDAYDIQAGSRAGQSRDTHRQWTEAGFNGSVHLRGWGEIAPNSQPIIPENRARLHSALEALGKINPVSATLRGAHTDKLSELALQTQTATVGDMRDAFPRQTKPTTTLVAAMHNAVEAQKAQIRFGSQKTKTIPLQGSQADALTEYVLDPISGPEAETVAALAINAQYHLIYGK